MLTPSYYCTWAAQNYLYGCGANALDVSELEGDAGADHANDQMREDILFGEDGFARFHAAARSGLYFLLDAGWDVPFSMDRGYFGCLEPAADRFPGCPREPGAALEYLNRLARERGWAGLGIWVAAQEAPRLSAAGALDQREYWKERLEWSARAGVDYWKVDWGVYQHDIEFRNRLTEWGHEYAPGLMIEQAYCQSCVNDATTGWPKDKLCVRTGRVSGELIARQAQLLEHCDVLRTYDVLAPLSIVQTVERVAALLEAMRGRTATGRALINCEDECYIAASLGLCAGVMRHPLSGLRPDGDPDLFFPAGARNFKRRMDEVTRMVNWQRVMPAFGASDEPAHVSELLLTDEWEFAPGESWLAPAIGRTVAQRAPAVVSRGLPLPEVKAAGEPPFVTASRHGDCAAVATHGRTRVGASWYEPLADVALELDGGVRHVGVFGRYGSLRLRGLQGRARARDLCGGSWRELDLSDGMVLDGALLAEIGRQSATRGDASAPGLEIEIY